MVDRPVLPYVDSTALGVGLFIACIGPGPPDAATLAERVTALRGRRVARPLSGEIVGDGRGVYHLLSRTDELGG